MKRNQSAAPHLPPKVVVLHQKILVAATMEVELERLPPPPRPTPPVGSRRADDLHLVPTLLLLMVVHFPLEEGQPARPVEAQPYDPTPRRCAARGAPGWPPPSGARLHLQQPVAASGYALLEDRQTQGNFEPPPRRCSAACLPPMVADFPGARAHPTPTWRTRCRVSKHGHRE